MVLNRYFYELDPDFKGFQKMFAIYVGRLWNSRSKKQGYGLHSKEECITFVLK